MCSSKINIGTDAKIDYMLADNMLAELGNVMSLADVGMELSQDNSRIYLIFDAVYKLLDGLCESIDECTMKGGDAA